MGTILLAEDAAQLEEVEVVAEKSQMQLKLDKRVFNVGKDVSNAGGNAAEILDNLPSVEVDLEGNVSLRGSANVRILIDGKPSGLVGISGSDALRQLQGDLIERIEVITNPSARYDAEGEVGILNIVLKKGRKKGMNGSFGLTTGVPENFGASYNLNFRRNKINWFSNFGINYRNSPGGGFGNFDFLDTGTRYDSEQDRKRKQLSGNIQLGMDWFINPQNTLTTSFLYKKAEGNNTSYITYTDYDADGNITRNEYRDENESEPSFDIEAAMTYEKQFGSKDHTLTIDAKYLENEDLESSTFENGYFDEQAPYLFQNSTNQEYERNILFQTDYIKPLSKNSKVEMGLKTTLREINNDFELEEQQEDGSFLEEIDNDLAYTENIYAAYAIYSNQHKALSYQFGLRYEYSDIETRLLNTNQNNPRTYSDFFPSIHFSYELSTSNQFQLSYSRRISRPRFWYLVPFLTFSDTRSLFSVNPDLNPEYTNSVELGYLKYFEKGSLLSSVYYRYRTGVIERVNLIVDEEEGITTRIPVNLSTQNAYGIEFSLSYEFFKWWKVNGNFNFYRAITEGEFEGRVLESDALTWSSRFNNKMTIFKDIDFQTSVRYRAPRITTQGRRLAMISVDTGFSKDILKGKGTITISAKDLFNSRKRRSETDLPNLFSYSEFQWRSRQFLAVFSYRFNQKKKRGGRRGGYDGGGEMDF